MSPRILAAPSPRPRARDVVIGPDDVTRLTRAVAQFRIVFGQKPARTQLLHDGSVVCTDHLSDQRLIVEAAK